ncbi:MAG TPA: NAD-dependent epimerase [Opitutaceae bacterium]|nr:NAD-dependent epimerase [Opitutaceae bacterium]HWB97065.1 NAD-dependent epimerase [Bryobacteraceae bacterium]
MILVTGCAGFIGFHLASRLLRDGEQVVGVDNLNDYYDVGLKRARLKLLDQPGFAFLQADLADAAAIAGLFAKHRPRRVAHLAAQAGVRYSLQNPGAYASSNLTGFLHVLEGCRAHSVEHLVYASSSSVYGLNRQLPFSAHHNVDHPISLYAATKKANELMAHSYSHLFRIPTTGLRFFTVYGPWGRPDMALFSFTRAILAGQPIDVYADGKMKRDFTYIDDVIEGVVRVLAQPAAADPAWTATAPDPATSAAPYRLYNIGNHSPVELIEVIATLEKRLGHKAVKRFLPAPPTEVPVTCADVTDLSRAIGFEPTTPLSTGVERFVHWYREYYR